MQVAWQRTSQMKKEEDDRSQEEKDEHYSLAEHP
jgi:hypothetical protein